MGEIQNQEAAKLYTIQIKDEEDKTNPVICRREKIDGKVVLTPVKWLQWKFSRVELSTYHSDTLDKDMENINIYLWDNEWEYKLSTAWTWIGRNLLNSLAWEKQLWELTIKVYAKESNWKMYARVSVYNDGQMTAWKLSIDAQKLLTETITKKDWTFVSNDYDALDNTLKNEIEEINKKVKYQKEAQKPRIEELEDNSNSDLPF